MSAPVEIFSYRPYWAKRFGPAPCLPRTKDEMRALGWDSCDVVLVTGDAYVDHPSFGMAVIGRFLESQGFRVGIIDQPDWRSADAFKALGKPNLFFGVTAGNMDSMVNRYTADKRIRSNDAYSPDGAAGLRPDRAVAVYSQRCREAFKGVPIIIGGIEASLRRIAHFDYWSDTMRRSVLVDSKADLLVYGNGERQIAEIAHRLAARESITDLKHIRGTAVLTKGLPEGWVEKATRAEGEKVDKFSAPDPYAERAEASCATNQAGSKAGITAGSKVAGGQVMTLHRREDQRGAQVVVRMPSYEEVKQNPSLYAHASRLLHLETNPGNARPLIQRHGNKEVWVNPPPLPLSTKELDKVFDLPYTRHPHPSYGEKNIPAYEMIRFSVNIMRGCFGGCTFCSITEHEGRIIQSRSESSIVKEIETIRDSVKGFTGIISDVGGPTANMYRLACKDPETESQCRRLSCVHPSICKSLNTDHSPLIQLYRRLRDLPGIKKVLVASGLRYDLAVKSPEYVKELVTHHVGGYLKIAPEHTEEGPLSKMMKPGMGAYDEFKVMFEKYSKEAGKEQYLIPYFIAAHPGTTTEDMLSLALWLKKNNFRLDQVQTYLPSPMALATAMFYSHKNPLKALRHQKEDMFIPKGLKIRRLHKAFLRFHDAKNWPILRNALEELGRSDLIGNGKRHLIPSWQPAGTVEGTSTSNRRHTRPVDRTKVSGNSTKHRPDSKVNKSRQSPRRK